MKKDFKELDYDSLFFQNQVMELKDYVNKVIMSPSASSCLITSLFGIIISQFHQDLKQRMDVEDITCGEGAEILWSAARRALDMFELSITETTH